MVRRPVILIVPIRIVDNVLSLISAWIDECERLTYHDSFPKGAEYLDGFTLARTQQYDVFESDRSIAVPEN